MGKIAVSIPDELVSAADLLAGRLGVSRNRLYAMAIAEFVAKNDPGEITARLDRLYARESSALDPDLRRAQRRSFMIERW